MSRELFNKSVNPFSLGINMAMNTMYVPDATVIENKGKELIRHYGNRARIATIIGGCGILVLDSLIIQLGLIYFMVKTITEALEDGRASVSRELWGDIRERNSFIVYYITPLVRNAVDSIIYCSEEGSSKYSDVDVKEALFLLKEFFYMNGWGEYFEAAKIQHPYIGAWMK